MADLFGSGAFAWRVLRAFGIGIIIAALVADSMTAVAGVTSTTSHRYYTVSGSSKSALARKMRSNPFRGDGGGAVANIRPKYSLNLVTKKSGAGCSVASADLKIHFTLTLPRANESVMSASTRSVWRSFVSFARRHEQRHRNIYLQCARNFVTKAQRVRAGSCSLAKIKARRLLAAEERACDKRHAAFDRSERRRLFSQPLFRTARR